MKPAEGWKPSSQTKKGGSDKEQSVNSGSGVTRFIFSVLSEQGFHESLESWQSLGLFRDIFFLLSTSASEQFLNCNIILVWLLFM